MPRATVSICTVAFNEEANIARMLESVVDWADEVIVLDCSSSDNTAELARSAGAVVYSGPNIIPEASKNKTFEYATKEWIFLLDPDELMTDRLKEEIDRLLSGNPSESGFKVPRRNHYFGAPLMHGGNYPDRQLRLFRRGRGRFPGVAYHERIVIDGTVGELEAPFDHHPYPTFEVWLHKFDWYTGYGARVLAEKGVPITGATIRHHMVTRPMRRWIERLFIKRGIRDGVPGVLAATFDLMTNVVSFGRYWIWERGAGSGERGTKGARD